MWPVPVGEGIASDLSTGRQAGRLHYIEYLPVVVDASCIHPFSSWVPLNCICISYPFPSMI